MYKCKVCKSKISPFFNLGKMPLVNSFLKKKDLSKEKKYDLTVAFCSNCYLVQLTKNVSPKILFTDYIYISSTSSTLVSHLKKTSLYLTKKLKLNKDSLVIEVASNDGVLLGFFKKFKIKTLGIDPARNIARKANKNGIKTLPEFFNLKLAKKLKEKNIQADLFFGANVLAHVPQIVDFAKGVKLILKSQGTAVFEFPYIKGLMENKFDTVYHEHVFYYSLIALQNLFNTANLEIYNVEMLDTQGGSLRIFVSHRNAFRVSKNVSLLVKEEIRLGYRKLSTYKKVGTQVLKLKKSLLFFLAKQKKARFKIAAYSAPAKGNVLLNYFGIDNNYLDFIVDKSEYKQGLYTPGTRMYVFPVSKIAKEKPDYLLILCWNIADEVIKELKSYKKLGGKFIIPVPKLKII